MNNNKKRAIYNFYPLRNVSLLFKMIDVSFIFLPKLNRIGSLWVGQSSKYKQQKKRCVPASTEQARTEENMAGLSEDGWQASSHMRKDLS